MPPRERPVNFSPIGFQIIEATVILVTVTFIFGKDRFLWTQLKKARPSGLVYARLRDFSEKTAWQKTRHAVLLLYSFLFLLLRWAAAYLNALYMAGDNSGQSSSNCIARSAADLTLSNYSLEGTSSSSIVKVLVIIEPPCKQIEQNPLQLEQSITLYHSKINLAEDLRRYKWFPGPWCWLAPVGMLNWL